MAEVPPRARPVPDVVRAATSFLGRETELGHHPQIHTGSRLLTVTGAGGIDKARLTLELPADDGRPHPEACGLSNSAAC